MDDLAHALRAWRDRLPAAEVGLPAGLARRTPGLRREELAALAGISVEYLVRLEQGRARHPSAQMLGALARALRLTEQERDHLYRIAGIAAPSPRLVPCHIPPGVHRMLDRMGDLPVAVYTAAWDLLDWNPLWAVLTGDPTPLRGLERNVAWRHFTRDPRTVVFDEQHAEEFSNDLTADLRETSGRYPDDPGLSALIARLRSESPDFARRWGHAHVAQHRSSRKTITSTPVGPIDLDCDVLTVPGSDLRIVVYSPLAGSDDASKLELLKVSGAEPAPYATASR